MPSNHCIVIGCDTKYNDKYTIRHRFPKDEKTCGVWVQKSGNDKLLNKSVIQIYQTYVICEKHFDASCKSPGSKKLIYGSIPTLNLPIACHISDTEVEENIKPPTTTAMNISLNMNHSDDSCNMSVTETSDPLSSTILMDNDVTLHQVAGKLH